MFRFRAEQPRTVTLGQPTLHKRLCWQPGLQLVLTGLRLPMQMDAKPVLRPRLRNQMQP